MHLFLGLNWCGWLSWYPIDINIVPLHHGVTSDIWGIGQDHPKYPNTLANQKTGRQQDLHGIHPSSGLHSFQAPTIFCEQSSSILTRKTMLKGCNDIRIFPTAPILKPPTIVHIMTLICSFHGWIFFDTTSSRTEQPLNLRVAATHMMFTASTTPGPGNHCSLASMISRNWWHWPLVTSARVIHLKYCSCQWLKKKDEYMEVSARWMFCSNQNIYNFDRLYSWMLQILLRCLIDSMALSLADSSS